MRRPFLTFAAIVTVVLPTIAVAEQTFPYQAVVIRNAARIYSGGNDEYYATTELDRETVVTVKRHDPGGWYMIAPPEGSFNWIPTRYVDRTAADAGTINEDNVIAWVGSDFGDETGVWQGRLSTGTRVQILEERAIDTERGPQQMYRIAPPARDHRWISGDAIMPIDDQTRRRQDQNPYRTPSTVRRQPSKEAPGSRELPSASRHLVRVQKIRKEQRKLAEIDHEFRTMIRRTPTEWDLERIETAYGELRSQTTWRPLSAQIDLRLPAIDRYRDRQERYESFRQLTSETERRDAELLARQYRRDETVSTPADSATMTPPTLEVAAADAEAQMDVALPLSLPAGKDSVSPITGASSPPTGGIARNSRYVGAGIIRSLPGGDFVLESSAGRQLARLQGTDSVDLEEFLGRSVGLHGQRWYREDLKSDFIEVTGLEPVRIRP